MDGTKFPISSADPYSRLGTASAPIVIDIQPLADDRCSFDTIVRVYKIADPALDHLATIIRGADASRRDLTPPREGLLAVSCGLSPNCRDDHEMLEHGHTWCRLKRGAPNRSIMAAA